MPGFDGTGPLGQGPMTGRGMGYCVLEIPEGRPFAPAFEQNVLARNEQIGAFRRIGKELITMPLGNGTGPRGMGPMTGRAAGYCAGYPVPGYMNPVAGRGLSAGPFVGAYGPAPYGQGMMPYGYGAGYGYGGGYGYGANYAAAWGRPFGGFGRGFGFGRGWGRGFGRGRGRGRW